MRIAYDAWTQIPIDPELVNLHLRIGDRDEMQQIAHQVYLPAAMEWAEGYTKRSLDARTHRWTLNRLSGSIMLPRGRCTAVESIAYWENSTTQVVLTGPSSSTPGTDYQEDLTSDIGAVLKPNSGESWPSADQSQISPIVITYTAGYSGNAPQDVQTAMLMYCADRLEIATEYDAKKTYTNTTAEMLLQPFRLVTF
jgi:hypothetical protein